MLRSCDQNAIRAGTLTVCIGLSRAVGQLRPRGVLSSYPASRIVARLHIQQRFHLYSDDFGLPPIGGFPAQWDIPIPEQPAVGLIKPATTKGEWVSCCLGHTNHLI
jgi:hypothetical protein